MNSEASPVLPPSRLPGVGTTIFTVMSKLASDHGAINLGQGFPDFPPAPSLAEAVNQAMAAGHHQYAPMAGVPQLRQRLAEKIQRLYGRLYDAETEITITAGATQAILTAVLALVPAGDDAIILEPAYDSYAPALAMAGARAVRVSLDPVTFRPDFERIAQAIGPRTRAILINSPHNPSGVVWTREEMQALADLAQRHGLFVISDEVYEHMVYDGRPHISASSLTALAERSIVISSFGKTYHVTGWKIGHVVAPAALMAEFRKVHQFNVFCVNTPMQHALAQVLQDDAPWRDLADFYASKRSRFAQGLAASGLEPIACEGTYFQCVRYGHLSDQSDLDFARWLTAEVGVAAVPLSPFYAQAPGLQVVRFCFAKQDATLDSALERLATLPRRLSR
ncbi:methionine aminotransferase [Ideonella livida]|uniref:Aminotransferase class I/II-fold pyridoxal phosphate-dependent enzyme n=1 Tax=Ideonella livida TaxID=2707176 RepID=A0A7C9TN34_9BURK|nr:methionine aminotransferase [Ideonella livida]NDY92166.1 aminotransferase class I/II-fold pyridoxal phosphate-dependent enzyme [Ideonella livida]